MIRMAVLDFETANHQPGSACQLGIVVVEPWRIVSEHQWLIRPQRLYFSPRCTQVHGLTARDVMDSRTWDSLWSEVWDVLDGTVVIAHNAGFDAKVLSSTCCLYEIALQPIDLQCTRLIAKRGWPALPSHALAAMAEHLSIRFRHHDALEDARAAATILMSAAEQVGANDLDALEERLGLVRGRIWTDRIRQPRTVRRSRLEVVAEPQPRYEQKRFRVDGLPMQNELVRKGRRIADEILGYCGLEKPLDGKRVVLLGTLLGLDREDSIGFLSNLGATVQASANLQTQYLIQGSQADPMEDSALEATGKVAEALQSLLDRKKIQDMESRQKDGQPIRIISQRQLLAMLPAGLQSVRGDV
jgi:DNA polymerase-3 subunit epsilon